jgi:hypothetical protein
VDNTFLSLNIFVILNYVIGSLGAYIYAKRYIKSDVFAFSVGILFSFCAYKMMRMNEHYNLIFTGTIPFVMMLVQDIITSYQLKDIFSRKNVNKISVLIGLFIIAILSDYYIPFYLGLFIVFVYIYQLLKGVSMPKLIIVSVITFIAIHLMIQWLRNHNIDDHGGIYWGAQLVDYFRPSSGSRLYQSILGENFNYPEMEQTIHLGYSTMILLVALVILTIIKRKIRLEENIKVLIFCLIVFVLITCPENGCGFIGVQCCTVFIH